MLYVHRNRAGICNILPQGTTGAEIGVFRGEFSRVLGKHAEPAALFLIDPWWKKHGEMFAHEPSIRTDDAYQATLGRMKWWLDRGIARVIVESSQVALTAMADASLDWAYLDSSHDFEETREELSQLQRVVKPNGIICGHDFNTRRHPGVFRAVVDFLDHRPEYELFYLDNCNQWAIRLRRNGAA